VQINLFDVDMVNLNKLLIDEQNELNHPKKMEILSNELPWA
jgi:hypothetical protein